MLVGKINPPTKEVSEMAQVSVAANCQQHLTRVSSRPS